MKFTKKKTIIAAVIFFIAIAFTSISYAQLNFGPYGDGYTAVWLLGHNALKFGNPINFNNGTLTNINEICLPDGCRTSWSNVTANLSGTLPFSSITGTIFSYQIAAGSIDQSKLGGLTLPFTNITGFISANQIANGSIEQYKLGGLTLPFSNISGYISPSQIAPGTINASMLGGLIVPAENVTPGTFGINQYIGDYVFPRNLSVNGTLNVSGLNGNTTFAGDVQIIGQLYGGSPVKIAGGVNVTGGSGFFGDIFVSSCIGCENFTAINSTITAINSTINGVITQQAIVRNYTSTFLISTPKIFLAIPLQQSLVYLKGEIEGLSNVGALVIQLNDDNQTNYMYKRIQALSWLSQAITVNPQRNVTLEGYANVAGKRTIEITLYINSTLGTRGDYKITSYTPNSVGLGNAVQLTYGGYVNVTTGSFYWNNISIPTTLSMYSGSGSNLLNGTYFIVDTER